MLNKLKYLKQTNKLLKKLQLIIFFLFASLAFSQTEADLILTLESVTDSSITNGNTQINFVKPGDVFQYFIQVENVGPDDAQALQVDLNLPEYVQYLGASPLPETVTAEKLSWQRDDLSVRTTSQWIVALLLDTQIPAEISQLVASAYVNSANDPIDASNSAQDTIQVISQTQAQCDISATINSITDTSIVLSGTTFPAVVEGKVFQYQINVDNFGPDEAKSIKVRTDIPDSTMLISYSPPVSAQNGDTLIWQINSISPGNRISLQYSVRVVDHFAFYPFPIQSNVQADLENDSNNQNNSDTELVYILPALPPAPSGTDLAIMLDSRTSQVENGESIVKPGQNFYYDIELLNLTNVSANNVEVTQALPTYVQYVQSSLPPVAISGKNVIWTFNQIESNSLKTWEIEVKLENNIPQTTTQLSSQILVSASNDTAQENNVDSDIVLVDHGRAFCDVAVDLQSSETDSFIIYQGQRYDAVYINNPFKYEIYLNNRGPAVAENVSVMHILPADVTYVNATPTPTIISGDTLKWGFAEMPAGAEYKMSIDVLDQLSNESAASSMVSIYADNDSTIYNNAAVKTLWFIFPYNPPPPPKKNYDLALEYKAVTDSTVLVNGQVEEATVEGNRFEYNINISNNGPAVAYDIKLTNNITSEVVFFSFDKQPGYIDESKLVWEIDSLRVGERWDVRFSAVSKTGLSHYPFKISTEALIEAENDTLLGNNSKEIAVFLLERKTPSLPDIAVKMSVSADSFVVEDSDTLFIIKKEQKIPFNLNIINLSAVEATNINVLFQYNDSLRISNIQPVPQSNDSTNHTIQWTFTSLPAFQTSQITFNGAAKNNMAIGKHILTQTVQVNAENEDLTKKDNNAATLKIFYVVSPEPPFEPFIEALPHSVFLGDSITVSVQFPVEIASWAIWIYLPDNSIIKDFAAEFIQNATIAPNVWYKINEPYIHSQLVGGGTEDQITFELRATGKGGGQGSNQTQVIVSTREEEIEQGFVLNMPNLYRPQEQAVLAIDFFVEDGWIEMNLYDTAGRLVTNLVNDSFSAGWHALNWDGTTDSGLDVGSGVYLVTMISKDSSVWKKVIIVR